MPEVHQTLVEVTAFLGDHPPFSALTDDALESLARSAEIEYFARGTEILAQEGMPSEHLYVVRRGAVELVDEGHVVDVLEEGESFGHPSLLSGMPPAFTARAREDSLCYLFPAQTTLEALADPAGVRFVAATLEERLEHRLATSHHATPWGTSHVGPLARTALLLPADTPVREAARRMSERDESSVVIVDDGFALVTDRDLREQVVAGDVSIEAPLGSLALSPGHTVRSDRLVLDAIVDMLEAGTEHLLVLDDDGALLGVLDHSAVLALDAPNPLVVRQRIERASTVDEVASAVSELPGVALRLLDASVEPLDILVVLATTSDTVARRLTELAADELGPPPAAWAWLVLGSEARREQTLATDQDNGLAYDGEGADVDEYFAAFAEHMNQWLARCGYTECRAGVMAKNAGWRLTRAGWIELLESWLHTPTRHQVHVAMIGLDLRSVAGPLPIERDLHELLERAPEHPAFLMRLAGAATERRPPTGFLRDLVIERSGEHVGTLDIKVGGVTPIVNLARAHALASGSAATSTAGRLRAAAARGSISEDTAQELHEAFVTVNRVRLEHQAAQVERGATPDNHVDPRELPPLARRQLKEAFRAIARAQRMLEPRTATRIP